jgi:hypothetical protein
MLEDITLIEPVLLPKVTVCPAVPAAVNDPVVVVVNVEVPALKLPAVVKLVAVNPPQVNEELVVLAVMIFPEELIINKLLFPEDGLVMLLAAIVMPAPVAFPSVIIVFVPVPQLRFPVVLMLVEVKGPVVVVPNVQLPDVYILVAVNPPQVNEEFVVLLVMIFPMELIINKLLFPDAGLVMLEDITLIEPVLFPKVTICPAVAAAVNDPVVVDPKVEAPAFNVPVVLMLFAVIAPVLVKAPQVKEDVVALFVTIRPKPSIINKL